MADLREERLIHCVQSLLELEDRISRSLRSLDPRIVAVLPDGFGGTVAAHRDALADYLRGLGGDPAVPQDTSAVDVAGWTGDVAIAGPLSVSSTALYGLLSYAVIRYAAVFEMSLKLYDQKLRDISPRHQQAHKSAASALASRLVALTADELAGDGLECQCVCPMCSLGACGCVAVGGLATFDLAGPAAGAQPGGGFTLEMPRTGSQLAAAGVVMGDQLLAIDDEPVVSVLDIQAAIRKHELGETVRLLIAHGDATRQIEVTHVGDY